MSAAFHAPGGYVNSWIAGAGTRRAPGRLQVASSVTDISSRRISLRSSERYLNRELSWLDFNLRVLETAGSKKVPLLERVRFLSISASNLDEFYMVRVAGLAGQVMEGVTDRTKDGLTPSRQLEAIREKVRFLLDSQHECEKELFSLCKKAGIRIVAPGSLDRPGARWLSEWFSKKLFPVLTPLAIDPAHPFPFIQNGSLVCAVQLARAEDGKRMKGLILLPSRVERFIRVPGGKKTLFVPIEKVIGHNMKSLFPGFEVEDNGIFQVTRDSLWEIDEDAEDLVETFETALKRRRGGSVIRVDVNADMPDAIVDFIMDKLEARDAHFFRIKGMLGLESVGQIILDERSDLLYRRMNIRYPERVREFGGDVIAAVQQKDFVVHHPYESFDVVVEFLKQAAEDPAVVAIKQTLYRTSEDSPIVKRLIEAAEAGKSVTAMVELKARFDEEANIRWAHDLEDAGVQVVYGFIDLKTHAKVSLVVRREGSDIRTYTHFGTGNYHPVNAKIYTDLSYFTADEALGRDAAKLFNYMTGYATPKKMERIFFSPVTMRPKVLELIGDEIEHAKAGRPAVIWAKMNSLVDSKVIDALYAASRAGVRVELFVRGICCLRPGVPGLSENIRVKSIVGRFLEHSRVICFGAGEGLPSDGCKVFISSADWMPRNLDRRVESLVPIENATVKKQLVEQVMVANLNDVESSWEMRPDGSYRKLKGDADSFSAHRYFMTNPSLSGRGKALAESRPVMPAELVQE